MMTKEKCVWWDGFGTSCVVIEFGHFLFALIILKCHHSEIKTCLPVQTTLFSSTLFLSPSVNSQCCVVKCLPLCNDCSRHVSSSQYVTSPFCEIPIRLVTNPWHAHTARVTVHAKDNCICSVCVCLSDCLSVTTFYPIHTTRQQNNDTNRFLAVTT